MLETFDALLRIGQIEAGARRAAFQPVDLAEIARDVAEAFRPAADDENKTLTVETATPLPLAGDKELLPKFQTAAAGATACPGSCASPSRSASGCFRTGAGGGLAHLLHRRQQQADQDGDDGDDHQQLDQRESTATRAEGERNLLSMVNPQTQ